MEENIKRHWLIRVGDGINFQNSNHAMWGCKRGRNNCIKSIILKINEGDILWFITNQNNGGKIIGMSEFISCYDRNEEPLLEINTYSNEDMGWIGNEDWDIQIHYKNLYETKRQDIKICIRCPSIIINYDNFREQINDDLELHYRNFLYYANPSKYFD